MNLLKWTILFTVAFVIAWVLIFTFTQPPFYEQVPARIFTYNTPSIPMYAYVSGAFGIGLLLGLTIALFYYITNKAELFKRSRTIRALESEIAELKTALEHRAVPMEFPEPKYTDTVTDKPESNTQ